MYKAIIEVGGYKVGDIVPDEKAKHWNKVFGVPHCEEVKDEKSKKPEIEAKEEVPSNDVMVDDYLDRNENVAVKNIREDKLPLETLKKLLAHEKEDKKRKNVIKALEKAIK